MTTQAPLFLLPAHCSFLLSPVPSSQPTGGSPSANSGLHSAPQCMAPTLSHMLRVMGLTLSFHPLKASNNLHALLIHVLKIL